MELIRVMQFSRFYGKFSMICFLKSLYNSYTMLRIQFLVFRYTHDTIYVLLFKQAFQVLVDLMSKFFQLNDIIINGFNSHCPAQDYFITIKQHHTNNAVI